MDIIIKPSNLHGEIKAIPSKSMAHRLLVLAALADRATDISCPELSRDIEATVSCLRAMGAGIEHINGVFHVEPIKSVTANAQLDCGESGSTLRFLLPVVCALGGGAEIRMQGRLPQRPLSPLLDVLAAHGAEFSRDEDDVLHVSGKLSSGEYSIRADITSQFVSGLLFALPLLEGESSLELTGSVESAGYIDMTRQAQKAFGVEFAAEGKCYTIPANVRYISPGEAIVEGDWSNSAFWFAADCLSKGEIKVTGLDEASLQGDKAVIELIELIRQGSCKIDVKNIPDLVPVLSVVAAVGKGKTEFTNAGRLRTKESDRLAAIRRMLISLGAECVEKEEGLIVYGQPKLRGGVVGGENDHRIVMSAAVAAIVCESPVRISSAEAVEKSYPGFFEDYRKLGGEIL